LMYATGSASAVGSKTQAEPVAHNRNSTHALFIAVENVLQMVLKTGTGSR
jgi:hypothetical protein